MTNSREVQTTIPDERHHKKVKDLDLNIGNQPAERVVGIHCKVKNDYLGKINLKDKPVTRKGMLSTINSICDPFGIAATFFLAGWKTLQKLYKLKVGCDEKIPDNLKNIEFVGKINCESGKH